MPRPEKVTAVSEIKDRVSGAEAVFLAEYAGLSVKAQQSLRRSLKAQGAEFQVVKMTLARRAVAELDLGDLDELLVGPTGITYADGDAVATAKVLRDFATANEVFAVKGGLLGTTVLTAERIRELADIEPRPVLLAKLAGLFRSPATAMAGLAAALPRGAATVLQALLDKKAAAEPAPEAPADVEGDAESGSDGPDVEALDGEAAGVAEVTEAATTDDAGVDAGAEAEAAEAEATEAIHDAGDDAEVTDAVAIDDGEAEATEAADSADAEVTEADSKAEVGEAEVSEAAADEAEPTTESESEPADESTDEGPSTDDTTTKPEEEN